MDLKRGGLIRFAVSTLDSNCQAPCDPSGLDTIACIVCPQSRFKLNMHHTSITQTKLKNIKIEVRNFFVY